MPGKCFIAGRLPPASRPDAKASARLVVVVALNDQVRPCWYMNEAVEEGTSATGARLLLIPAHDSALPVDAPWDRAAVTLPAAPIWGADRVGGAHGTRLTEPPSWSVEISRGG